MDSEDIDVVRQAFEAFDQRDLARLEGLSSPHLVVENAVTGSATGVPRSEGPEALGRYFGDVERVWEDLKLRPRTFKSSRSGEVLVLGSVSARRTGGPREVTAVAWIWRVASGKVTFVRILPAVPPRGVGTGVAD